MTMRKITEDVHWLGAVDWDRRLFDAFEPLPDGTSYNCYLVRGSDKTALIDTVDPTKTAELIGNLAAVPNVDYVVVNHVEQDHSGSLPQVLDKYPGAKVLCTAKAKSMLADHLPVSGDRVVAVEDGQSMSLGNKTFRFITTPWVHWPETMSTYLEEDKLLFCCDLFGSHLATSDLFATDKARVFEAARRYYAEIMMPFANHVGRNLDKLSRFEIRMIAPSHGPVYDDPKWIMEAYREWAQGAPRNLVLVLSITMHGSTQLMVNHLIGELLQRGVGVQAFDVSSGEFGRIPERSMDAATVVLASPMFLGGPHPSVAFAASVMNLAKPKTRFVSVIGSMGWGGHMVEQLKEAISSLKVEMLDSVLCKGLPKAADYAALTKLAETIESKHKGLNLQ